MFSEIKNSISLEQHISKYIPVNARKFKCIHHNDSNPSASIKNDSFYKCFSCDASGDVITFHKTFNRFSSNFEAAKDLVKMYNLDIKIDKFEHMSPEEKEKYILKEEILSSIQLTMENSMDDKTVRFLKEKYGIDEFVINSLSFGFVEDKFLEKIHRRMKLSISDYNEDSVNSILLETGIFKRKNKKIYCPFEGRLSVPFYRSGKISTYQFRLPRDVVGEEKKILFISEEVKDDELGDDKKNKSILYEKDCVFFTNSKPNFTNESKKFLVAVEGFGDAAAVFGKGFYSAAYSGSGITEGRAENIKKNMSSVSAKNLIIWIDWDGEKAVATKRFLSGSVISLIKKDMKHRIFFTKPENVLEKEDPADFIKRTNCDTEFLVSKFENSKDGIEFAIDELEEDEEVVNLLSLIENHMSPIDADKYLAYASKKREISKKAIREQIKRAKSVFDDDPEEITYSEVYDIMLNEGYEFYKYIENGRREELEIKNPEGNVIKISGDKLPMEFKSFLQEKFGLVYADRNHKIIIMAFISHAYTRAFEISKEGTWIYNDGLEEKGLTDIYCAFGSNPKELVMIDKEGEIHLKKNPSKNESVKLSGSSAMKEAHFFRMSKEELSSVVKDMKRLVIDSVSCEPCDAYMSLMFMLSSIVNRKREPSPAIWFKGGSGSGKTTAAKIFQSLLTGMDDVSNSQTAASVWFNMKENPVYVLDNIESDALEGKEDFIISATTTKTKTKMAKGGGDGNFDKILSIPMKANLIITSIEPTTKTEINNRCIEIFCKSSLQKKISPTAIINEIISKRDSFISAWIYIYSETIKNKNFKSYFEKCRNFVKTHLVNVNRFENHIAFMICMLSTFIKLEGSSEEKVVEIITSFSKTQSVQDNEQKAGGNICLEFLETLLDELEKRKSYDESAMDSFEREINFSFSWNTQGDIIIEGKPVTIFNYMSGVYKNFGRRLESQFKNSAVLSSRLSDENSLKNSRWSFSTVKKGGNRYWVLKNNKDGA